MDLRSLVVLLLTGLLADAYHVLILYPSPSFSHQQPIMALTKALIAKGHRVFAVTPKAVHGLGENYTHIDVSFTQPSSDMSYTGVSNDANLAELSFRETTEIIRHRAEVPAKQFKSEAFSKFQRQVVQEKLQFDVVISEAHFCPFLCGIARLLGAGAKPLVGLTTFPTDFTTEKDLSSPLHLSFMPCITPFSNRMSLWQRLQNWFVGTYFITICRRIMEAAARKFFREVHGTAAEALVDGCWRNVSLLLVASNFLYYYPRVMGPNVVEVGPMHIRPVEKLPQDLQDWLGGAKKGVIYFSLGSNLKSKSLPEEVLANFIRAFKELPNGYRVLWKWETDDRLPGQSQNILTQKWLPQQSVLAHPKVKLFITHGGLQSFQEAIHWGVPTVGIPFFGDQVMNGAKMVETGIGLRLLPQELSVFEKVRAAIETVLLDESYSKNMKRLSGISRDFTAQSIPKAVFWVEHVAKHGGAAHLRPSTADVSYFQYFCLDLICFVLAVSVGVLYIIILTVRLVAAVIPKILK